MSLEILLRNSIFVFSRMDTGRRRFVAATWLKSSVIYPSALLVLGGMWPLTKRQIIVSSYQHIMLIHYALPSAPDELVNNMVSIEVGNLACRKPSSNNISQTNSPRCPLRTCLCVPGSSGPLSSCPQVKSRNMFCVDCRCLMCLIMCYTLLQTLSQY